MPAFLRRMFGAGSLPADLRTTLESEGLVLLAENLSVIRRFSGSVPGLHSGASVSRTSGALAFTSQRIVTTLGVQSSPASIAVDCGWDATDQKPMKIEISGDGVTLDVDVRKVSHDFHGHLLLHYRYDIPADVLARLPQTSLRQDISAEFVCRALGVRPREPDR